MLPDVIRTGTRDSEKFLLFSKVENINDILKKSLDAANTALEHLKINKEGSQLNLRSLKDKIKDLSKQIEQIYIFEAQNQTESELATLYNLSNLLEKFSFLDIKEYSKKELNLDKMKSIQDIFNLLNTINYWVTNHASNEIYSYTKSNPKQIENIKIFFQQLKNYMQVSSED